jgi:segregation and condensation protein B
MDDFFEKLQFTEDNDSIKGIIECILFAAGDPISIRELSEMIEIDDKRVRRIIEDMNNFYNDSSRGLYIVEFNNKFQLSTKPEYGSYVKKLIKPEGRQNLSQAAMETLAIVSYRQPITRIDIDELRGVRSDRAIATLLEKGLIKEAGRMDTVGRPILYGTTEDFLKYFGFKNIKELPELIEFNMEIVEE